MEREFQITLNHETVSVIGENELKKALLNAVRKGDSVESIQEGERFWEREEIRERIKTLAVTAQTIHQAVGDINDTIMESGFGGPALQIPGWMQSA